MTTWQICISVYMVIGALVSAKVMMIVHEFAPDEFHAEGWGNMWGAMGTAMTWPVAVVILFLPSGPRDDG